MKIIFSRKGFDSAFGGFPSPIFPDGSILSFPIPMEHRDAAMFQDIKFKGSSVGPLIEELTAGKIVGQDTCHFDPDLDAKAMPRQRGWRPLLGQVGPSEKHLANNNVRPGDLFLFFGWFRRAEKTQSGWRFTRDTDTHSLWGWLSLGAIIELDGESAPDVPQWATYHPHVSCDCGGSLFVAQKRFDLGSGLSFPGAGVFRKHGATLQLSDPGRLKSTWKLPRFFHPSQGATLSYHTDHSRWSLKKDSCRLATVGRGQEFVFQTTDRESLSRWLKSIFENHA